MSYFLLCKIFKYIQSRDNGILNPSTNFQQSSTFCHTYFISLPLYFPPKTFKFLFDVTLLAVLGGSSSLCRLFSCCVERGLLLVDMCGLFLVAASLVADHRLQGTWSSVVAALVVAALVVAALVVAAHGLSCPAAYGIFLDQVSDPCPLLGRWILNHWTIREIQASQS